VELAQAFVSTFIIDIKVRSITLKSLILGKMKEINLRRKGNTQLKQSKLNENESYKSNGNVKQNWNVNQTDKHILSEVFKIRKSFHIVRDRFITIRTLFPKV